jgi:hypothetical protein
MGIRKRLLKKMTNARRIGMTSRRVMQNIPPLVNDFTIRIILVIRV